MNTPKTFNSCLSITLVFISLVSMSGCAAFDAHLQQIAKALGTKADWNAVRYTMYCEKLPNGRAFDQARREIEAITPIIVRGGIVVQASITFTDFSSSELDTIHLSLDSHSQISDRWLENYSGISDIQRVAIDCNDLKRKAGL